MTLFLKCVSRLFHGVDGIGLVSRLRGDVKKETIEGTFFVNEEVIGAGSLGREAEEAL